MTITVRLQPGESIGQALVRAALIANDSYPITIPPGVHIVGAGNFRQTRIIERRTTGIPFLGFGDQP